MKLSEYVKYDGLGLAELVKNKEVTPKELREAALQVIEKLNPKINAIANMIPGDLEITTVENVPKGPFEGVPFMLKDVPPMIAGLPFNNGSRFLEGLTSNRHHNLMIRFREAGLVAIATTTVPEMSASGTTESVLYGDTRNPWNKEYSAGGSSGGSAASVAAGFVPLAHGGDGGGSIRLPASYNGLIGLKPTRGRVPNGPDRGEAHSGTAVQFLLTKSVRDTAAILDAVGGPDVGCYAYVAKPDVPFLEQIKNKPRKLRIAWSDQLLGDPVDDPDTLRILHDTVQLCRDLGHEVVQAFPRLSSEDIDDYGRLFGRLSRPHLVLSIEGAAKALNRIPSEENLEPSTWAAYQAGKEITAVEMAEAMGYQNKISRFVGQFFLDYDVLLTPCVGGPTPLIGESNPNRRQAMSPEEAMKMMRKYGQFLSLYNLIGTPAINLPLGFTAQGMPMGMQFGAGFGDEASLLNLAAQIEEARPWKAKRPALLDEL